MVLFVLAVVVGAPTLTDVVFASEDPDHAPVTAPIAFVIKPTAVCMLCLLRHKSEIPSENTAFLKQYMGSKTN